jgi:fatty acyl-CoA reductase
LIGKRPNTYTYTKALAETLFVKDAATLPAAIVRPSIVAAAWKEPIPGWIDNLNGATGLIVGAGKGLIRSILCYREKTADLIPVDVPINLMIAVGWYTAVKRCDIYLRDLAIWLIFKGTRDARNNFLIVRFLCSLHFFFFIS